MDGSKPTHLSNDYLVYSDGRVFSIRNNIFLKTCVNNRNYLTVRLYINKKRTQIALHRLVGIAFLGDAPDGKTDINHIDGNKHNNDISNLEWTNDSDNGKHAYSLGLKNRIKHQGENSSSSVLTEKDILEIRQARLDKVPYKVLALKYKVTMGHIANIVSRRVWKHI